MPRQKSPERRQRIIEAARQLFGTQGYHCTHIADIAKRLGMGHGTFYRYFKNKRDIFEAVVNELTGRLASLTLTEDPTASNDLQAYRTQVERIGRKLHALFAEDPTAARVIFHEAYAIDDAMRTQMMRAFDLLGRFTEAYLKNGVEKGFLDPDLDVPTMSLAINAAVVEGVRRTVTDSDPNAAAERWISTVSRLMFDGIAARTSA